MTKEHRRSIDLSVYLSIAASALGLVLVSLSGAFNPRRAYQVIGLWFAMLSWTVPVAHIAWHKSLAKIAVLTRRKDGQ